MDAKKIDSPWRTPDANSIAGKARKRAEFPAAGGEQKEKHPSPEHLQSGAHAKLPRQIEMAAGNHTPSPEETAQEQDQRRCTEATVMKARGNHKHNDTRNAEHDAGQRLRAWSFPTENHHSASSTQTGIVAAITAASPEGTSFSAQKRQP